MAKKTSDTPTPKRNRAPKMSPMKRKEDSRKREIRRSKNINEGFDSLQRHIPYLHPDERRRMPKIKTLRLAVQYINHLNQLLQGDQMHQSDCDTDVRPLVHSDFRMTVASEMRMRNNYRERAMAQEMDQGTVQRILEREEERRNIYKREELCLDEPFAPGPSTPNPNLYSFPSPFQPPIPMLPVPQFSYSMSPDLPYANNYYPNPQDPYYSYQ